MKSTFKLFIVLVLMLGVFGQATTASAAEMYKWKGPGAQAEFFSSDGCTDTYVSLFTRDEKFHNPPGKPTKAPFVSIYINQYDYCGAGLVVDAWGFASGDAVNLQVANKLDWASLQASVEAYNWVSDSFLNLYVDLTWTATGPASRESSRYRFKTPGCQYQNQFKGTFRPAEVNGTISDGSTNFTPWTGWGTTFDSMGSEKWIGCGL